MDRGVWQATAHGITESDTTEWLSLSREAGVTAGKFGYEQLQGKAKISLTPGMERVWEDMLGRASAKKT